MIAVTGATGQLGRLVIESLLDRNVAPSELVAVVRNPDKAKDIAERGIEIRRADYTQPEALSAALKGIDKLLLISSSEIGSRLEHHRNVLDAAKEAGIERLVYTSLAFADSSPLSLAEEHKDTEALIREGGFRYTILRNGWYTENYTVSLAQNVEHGAMVGSARDGRVSMAPRKDYAEAAAVVLTTDGHEGAVYELGGDKAYTMSELAQEISRAAGKEVVYRDMSTEEHAGALVGFGLPESAASVFASFDTGIAQDYLYVESGDLSRLIGRPTTPVSDTIKEALAS